MSDEITEPTASEETAPAEESQPPAEAQKTDSDPAEHMMPKARFDEINSRLKALEKEKTDLQKAQEAAKRKAAEEQGEFQKLYEEQKALREEAERIAQDARLSMLRQKVGTKHKLPDALVGRLQGETEDEIEADAKAIMAALPKPETVTTTDAGQGVNATAPRQAMSDEEIREMAAIYGISEQNLKQIVTRS